MRMRFRCALSSSSKEEEEERSLFAQTVKRFGFWSVKDHGAPPDSVLFGEEELCAIVDEDEASETSEGSPEMRAMLKASAEARERLEALTRLRFDEVPLSPK